MLHPPPWPRQMPACSSPLSRCMRRCSSLLGYVRSLFHGLGEKGQGRRVQWAKPLAGAWPERPATTVPGVRAGQGRRFHGTVQYRQTRHSQGLGQKCQGVRCQGPGQRVQGRSFQGLGQQSQGPGQPDQGRGSGQTGQRRRLLGLQARIHGQPSCRNAQARCAMHLGCRTG